MGFTQSPKDMVLRRIAEWEDYRIGSCVGFDGGAPESGDFVVRVRRTCALLAEKMPTSSIRNERS